MLCVTRVRITEAGAALMAGHKPRTARARRRWGRQGMGSPSRYCERKEGLRGPRDGSVSRCLPKRNPWFRCALLRLCWHGDKVPAMTETVTTEGRPARRDGRDPAPVSATALAEHLACTRQYIVKLTIEGIIARSGNGYDQDASRVRYLNHLRSENRRSPRTAADAAFIAAKTQMLEMKLMEKRKQLVRRDEANALLDEAVGVTLTHLSAWPARIAGPNLELRRRAEALLVELRRDIAIACDRLGDERGEPPLDQQ